MFDSFYAYFCNFLLLWGHNILPNNMLTVTFTFLLWIIQEWPEEEYPPYANGPGYIVSSDIAQFIIAEFENHKLRVCCTNLIFVRLSLCLHMDACLHHVNDLLV